MATNKKLTRKLDCAAERVQPALLVLAELRRALDDGKPLSVVMMHVDELTDMLLGVEAAVGVVTPARLFE